VLELQFSKPGCGEGCRRVLARLTPGSVQLQTNDSLPKAFKLYAAVCIDILELKYQCKQKPRKIIRRVFTQQDTNAQGYQGA
jgi:hypothetical protein